MVPASCQSIPKSREPRGYAGYAAYATTTRYGDADRAACGGMHTGALIGGLPYYSVASAQSMWSGCCWCGGAGGGRGTMGLGCFSCAKGRFLKNAYGRLAYLRR